MGRTVRLAVCAWAVAACTSSPVGRGELDDEVDEADAGRDSQDAGHGSQDAAAGGPAPYLEPPLALPRRTGASDCELPGTRADALPRLQPQALGGDLRFVRALGLAPVPGAPDVLFVFEQHGLLHRVDLAASPESSRVALDLSAAVACCQDGSGLRGMALHPDYTENGFVFLHYVRQAAGSLRVRVSRFTSDPASDLLDPASERVVLELQLPGEGRAGGPLLFDSAGMLLIALGDGGEAPPGADSRRPSGLLGAVLRIDVDDLERGGYAIPDDNPFAGDAQGAPGEVFAWGLRDPQHCAIDSAADELWCSDRGPVYSELDLVEARRHYGWPEVDGTVCVATGRLCTDTRFAGPRASYRHFEGQCGVVGGSPNASGAGELLDGVVVYADACSGVLSGAARRGSQSGKRGRMGMLPAGVRALGSDGRGGVVAIDGAGQLVRLVVASDGIPGSFPERLSETGCYADIARHEPAAELIEFRIRSPLWSDGTIKRRFLRLPDGARIDAPSSGGWMFPVGTLLVKQFAFQFDDRDPLSVRPVETRFMLRRADGWEFHGYRWNASGDEAELVTSDSGADYELLRDGRPVTQRYQFPGAQTCPICHAAAPGRALGPRTEQLNRMVVYAGQGEAQNQLEVLAALELFDMPAGPLPRLPDPADRSLPLEQRARSYLHGNCAHCHQPEGWSSPDLTLDLRYELSLSETQTCGVEPQYFRQGSARIAPGAPSDSAILIRMRDTELDRMPPVATTVIDPLGDELLSAWIEELSSCP